MTRQFLLEQAAALPAVSVEAAAEYGTQHLLLAEEVTRMLGVREDLERLIGSGNLAMMEDNHRNHGRFVASLLQAFNPEVLVETILWVFRAYRSHGFQLTYWPAQLDAWLRLLPLHLSAEAAAQIIPLYQYMLMNQPAFAALSEETVTNDTGDRHA